MIKRIVMVCGIAAGACAWAATAAAQQSPPLSQLVPKVDATMAADSPYGLAMVDHFAKAIAASAGATCVKSRKLDDAAFHKGARDILIANAPHVQGILDRILDSPEFAEQLARALPKISTDELRSILGDPVVAERAALLVHDSIANLLDLVMERIDQVSVIERLLKKRVGALATGDATLMKISEQRIAETDYAMDLFDKANPSPHTVAFKEVWLAWPLILLKSAGSGQWAPMRPVDYVPGLAAELGKLCVGQP